MLLLLLNYRGKETEKPAYAFRSTENQLSKFNLPHQKQRQKGDKRPFLSHYHKRSNGTPAHGKTTCIYTRAYTETNFPLLIRQLLQNSISKFHFRAATSYRATF